MIDEPWTMIMFRGEIGSQFLFRSEIINILELLFFISISNLFGLKSKLHMNFPKKMDFWTNVISGKYFWFFFFSEIWTLNIWSMWLLKCLNNFRLIHTTNKIGKSNPLIIINEIRQNMVQRIFSHKPFHLKITSQLIWTILYHYS